MRELNVYGRGDWWRSQAFRWSHPAKPRFHCPICGYQGPFEDVDAVRGRRLHERCPRCGSKVRHRIQYLAVAGLLDERDTSRLSMIHFAPEKFFRAMFSRRFGRYETADLSKPGVDHHVDLQCLPFADATYDFVHASHVLEHVADDARAIREIRRILKPGGIAVLPVPIVSERTVEYGEANPLEHHHVRAPGYDYFDRYRPVFARVELVKSEALPEIHQVFSYDDGASGPRPGYSPVAGTKAQRRGDVVPICYA